MGVARNMPRQVDPARRVLCMAQCAATHRDRFASALPLGVSKTRLLRRAPDTAGHAFLVASIRRGHSGRAALSGGEEAGQEFSPGFLRKK